MLTKSFTSPRRLSAWLLTLLLFCGSFSNGAQAEPPRTPTPALVTGSFATTLTPPSGLKTVYQTALDSQGDLLVVDYAIGGLYEYPVNGGAVITLVGAGGLGAYNNPGIAIGANNDLYLEANFNNCLLRFPYNTTTNTWDGLSTVTAANTSATICPGSGSGTSPYIFAQYGLTVSGTPAYPGYYQPWAIAVGPNNNLVINSQNSGNFIFSLGVTGTGSTSAHGTGAMILDTMSARAQSIAKDKFGNIYFVEETDQKAPLPGVFMIPAGSTNVASEAGLTRVDPNLPAVTGVTTDASGNLYISDSKDGVFLVPNPAGTPQTSAAVLLTPVPAYGQVSVDLARGIVYVPTQVSGAEAIAKVTFNAAELGSTAAGTAAATSQSVLFGFNGAATPGSFVIQEAGAATPDFTIATGGTCVAGTAYAAQAGCTVNVTLSPHAAGDVSAKLLMLDAAGNTLGSLTLQGTGTGSAVQVVPGTETAIGAGLKTPSQIAVDANGNTYVADAGLGAVEVYPKGSGAIAATATAGTGLTAPTGVAVDGAGDVFIADSGNVSEVAAGPAGLNTAGQVTLKSGLGTKLKLAADGFGDLYISDPDNHRVVKLATAGAAPGRLGQMETDLGGFNAPSAIAVDASGNLYVADGSNLIEVTAAGTQTTLLSSLRNATGLAVDPSGAVYVTEPGGTIRIPDVGGALTPASQTTVASNVTAPTSVAIDPAENVYVTDATAENVELVGASASTNFGTLSSTTGTQTGNYTVLNVGNSPLNISGFSSTPDYSATANTCSGPIAVGASCTAMVTFNPGPGDQGTLAGQVLVQSDAANAPVGVNVTGVGAALAGSTTTVTVSNATVDGAPAVITVAATAKGGVAPTGLVTLTITGKNLTKPVIVSGMLANGAVTLTPPQLAAGAYTYSIAYQGDRAYGTSTATTQVSVGVGAVTLIQPTAAAVQAADPAYPLVLATGQGAAEPYDSSASPFYYTYPVKVVATDGVALIGQTVIVGGKPVINYGSVTYMGAPTFSCQPVPVAADGTAPFSTSCFSINTSNNAIPDLETAYTVTPVYSPTGAGASCDSTTGVCPVNPNYATATGAAISFTALRNPVVQITSNPSTLTVAAGSTTTATLTLTSVLGYGFDGYGAQLNNYSLPVQLACDGLPAYATCTFSYPTPDPTDPNSVDVGPKAGTIISGTTACTKAQGCYGPGTVMMTINTNIPTGIAGLRRGPGQTVFAAMFGLGLLGFAFGRKKPMRRRIPMLLSLLLCCAIMAGVSGCTTTQLGTTANGQASPAGTYTVLVTAKQVGSQVITSGGTTQTVYGNSNQVSLPFSMKVTVQ